MNSRVKDNRIATVRAYLNELIGERYDQRESDQRFDTNRPQSVDSGSAAALI